MINLILDAFKATQKSGMVRVLASYDDYTEMLTFHVASNGQGLEQQYLGVLNEILVQDELD